MKLENDMQLVTVRIIPHEAELPEAILAFLLSKMFGRTRLDDIVIRDLRRKNGLK